MSEGSQSDFEKATDYAKRIVRGGFCDDEELAMMPDYADSDLSVRFSRQEYCSGIAMPSSRGSSQPRD